MCPVIEFLHKLQGVPVLCVGDIMLDRFVYGEATRLSPEAPIPVVVTKRTVSMSGGMGNVVRNLGELGVLPLSDFRGLQSKSIRVIQYKDNSRLATIRELGEGQGYACGFNNLIERIDPLFPKNEIISRAYRCEIFMFPPEAVRELAANAVIHQDFRISGASPMIEIFSNRLEITNPGLPLVKTERFLDSPPHFRNEILAGFMRRINICEERGKG